MAVKTMQGGDGVKQRSDIVGVLPERLAGPIERVLRAHPGDVFELRLIRDRCAFLVCGEGLRFLSVGGVPFPEPPDDPLTAREEDLEELLDRAAGYSGFAHEEELRQSFLTRPDGTRIGIAFSGGPGRPRAGVGSLCIRFPVAREGEPQPLLDGVLTALSGGLLIAGAPNTGKTTLLRHCCRFLSEGLGGRRRKVCAVDERRELAGANGAFDLGGCTDVIAGQDKREAILTALRLLSPEVIVCDEIGSARETECLLEGLNSGVILIASLHARDLTQLVRRQQFRRLFAENVFAHVALLAPEQKGVLRAVYDYEEVAHEIHRCGGAFLRGAADLRLAERPAEEARGAAGAAG